MLLQGQLTHDGGVAVTAGEVTLVGPDGAPRYQGSLQGLQGAGAGVRLRAVLRGSKGPARAVLGTLQLTPDGRVSGLVKVGS